jgi:hypothetical protein
MSRDREHDKAPTPPATKLNDRDVLSLMTGLLGSLISSGLADGLTIHLAVREFSLKGTEYVEMILATLPEMAEKFEQAVMDHLDTLEEGA